MSTTDFLNSNATDGQLSADQAAQLLELAMGDTGDLPDNGGAPAVTPDTEQQPNDALNESADDPDKAVLLARDGKHTIPYDRLVEAREQSRQYKTQLDAQQQELETLRAQSQERAAAGDAPTQTDKNLAIAEQALSAGVDPDLFGDFSEEAIAAGVAKLVDARVEAAVSKALSQQKQQQQSDDVSAGHFNAIYGKHPDADSIRESRELAEWMAGKKAYEQRAINQVLDDGTAAEVIELLDSFKTESGQAQPAAASLKAAAKTALAGVRAPVPASLSDFPSGTANPSNRFESIASMTPDAMAEAMDNMSPEQIDAFLNRSA